MAQQQPINIERILNNTNNDQLFIMKTYSHLVGRVLTEIEVGLPKGGQYDSVKRSVNQILYTSRNKILHLLVDDSISNDIVIPYLVAEFEAIHIALNNKLDAVFPVIHQQRAIKISIQIVVNNIKDEIFYYFGNGN